MQYFTVLDCKGRNPILIATDVASRGLDVEDIKFVINFDFPNCSEDYVHRIGRTGRSTNTGTAYTFFTQRNSKQATDLVNVLREAKQVISPKLLQLEEGSSRGGGRWRGGRGGNRFSGGGSRFSGGSSYNSRSTNSYGGGGGFKSNSYSSSQNSSYSNGGFKAQNGFSSSTSNSYGSSQSKPFQNGSSGGFQAQWGQGGVTATSLSAVPPPSTF